jgi:hypothetical protein
MSQTDNQIRQNRIATLLKELAAAIREDRRCNDVGRRRQIESELVLLLEAEISSRKKARHSEATAAETSG